MQKQQPAQSRNTRQKAAIREAFLHAGRPLSPEETVAIARCAIEVISLATVYRNIHSLIAEKWLVPVELPGQSTRYEIAGKAHHHHFQCNDCGKLFELTGCEISAKPKLPRGFLATGHELFVYGKCAECR